MAMWLTATCVEAPTPMRCTMVFLLSSIVKKNYETNVHSIFELLLNSTDVI